MRVVTTLAWLSALVLCAATAPASRADSAAHFRARSFKHEGPIRYFPEAFTEGGLAQGPDGALYGVAQFRGDHEMGRVFRLTPGGANETVYSFTGGADGQAPGSALLLGRDGWLYGMAYGGANLSLIHI